jgi:O-antigen/teichoic acid export membrane protein
VALLSAVLLVSGVNWFYETLLQRELAFGRRFACQMVRTAAFSVVAIELALLGAGAWSLPAAYLCSYLAHAIVLVVFAPYRVRPAFEAHRAREIVRDGRGFLGQDLATFASQNADYLAVGRILGPAQLGFYAMAYRQAELPHYAIAEPVGKVTFPAFAQMRERGEDVRASFLRVLRSIALVTCPAGVILSAAAVPFSVALLGEDWRPVAAPLAVLGIWAVMRPLQVTVGTLLNSLGRAGVYGRVSLIALPPLIAGTFLVAPLGTTAVAWVLLAHMMVTFVVLVLAAARHAGVAPRALAAALWPFAPASAAAWIATRATADALDEAAPITALAACVAVCLATYVAVLALLAVIARRRAVPAPWPAVAAVAAAAVFGALAGVEPKLAVGLAGGALLVALPFVAPVAHLVLLLLVTTIAPYDLQSALAFGRGAGSPGLLPSDVLLLGGLARAILALLEHPPARRARWMLAVLLAVLAAAALQAVHGVANGYEAGTAGAELRVLAGFGAAAVALPLLADPATRRRLLNGLLGVGLAVGLWGMVQWTVDIPFTAAGDAGVREGVRLTEGGRGQIQGGLFAFPVAVVMGVAALLSRELRARALVVVMVALNAVGLLLTYERTFWVATLLALAVLVARSAPRQRVRALVAGPALVGLALAVLAVAAPRDVEAAGERLLSIGQYDRDLSVRFRLTETRHVMGEIERHPLAGAGLGATILWGRAYEGVRPTTESFAHNGYLWLAWKLGAPAAALLVLLLGAAVLLRGPPDAMRLGAQASLLLLLVASVTFPAFNTLGITATMGVLLALCAQGAR